MEKKSRSSSNAFTLLEMLVVVAIILLLAALLIPGMNMMKESANQTACLSHMKQVAAVINQYSADNNSRLLPAASGANNWMNDNVWYELLDESGLLPADPSKNQGDGWGGKKNSIMSCPSRDAPPYPYTMGGKFALHFTVNQNPGFLNRVNTTVGNWSTLAKIARPSRTFMLAESTFVLGYPDGENLAYPHPRNGKPIGEGGGMNLVFYDGHAESFKGRLPVLPGSDYAHIPYDQISPENSFPWF